MRIGLCWMLLTAAVAWAAPHVPRDDREVLERLPVRPSDPLAAELRTLRAAVAAAPADPMPAVQLARRYFDLAMAQGDPDASVAQGARRPRSSSGRPVSASPRLGTAKGMSARFARLRRLIAGRTVLAKRHRLRLRDGPPLVRLT